MHVKRRRLPNFESCSVALFASLAIGGANVPARAQTVAPSARSTPSPIPPQRPAALRPKTRDTAAPAAREAAVPQPDGSISSAGFDESLK